MRYAKIVLGLPVEGPFDYVVPQDLSQKIKVGMRVVLSFGSRKLVGFIVGLSKKTKIKNLKTISELIDDTPILDKDMLLLTKKLADYYCCSWGEVIETALPQGLRKGKKIAISEGRSAQGHRNLSSEAILVHDLDGKARWDIYVNSIKEALNNNRSAIILLPDINSVLQAREIINARLGILATVLYRGERQELEEWLKVKEGKVSVVLGTRSSIFAPLKDLGLIIIDEEHHSVYKQDQVPHYHAREAAFMRSEIEKAKIILGSASPSLEVFHLAKKKKIRYILIPKIKPAPEIKIIDISSQYYKLARKNIFSKYLAEAIASALNSGEKILLFLNRQGFATTASCQSCGKVLKCGRCNINLVYHFKDNILKCHYCNFKVAPPNICPECNSGYIRYLGAGTEKIESELSRIFPQAKIKRLDSQKAKIDIKDTDIVISTSSIIRESQYNFGLICVLKIDGSLNRIDFRAAEKTFQLLVGLLGLAGKTIIIQTKLAQHHIFKTLISKNVSKFYDEELKERRQLGFPPYQHLGLVKVRGKKEDRVREVSYNLFERLKEVNKNKSIQIISVSHSEPAKLRGNFYWQILVKAHSAKKISKFLKNHLKDFRHSGIIVTVDIDPL